MTEQLTIQTDITAGGIHDLWETPGEAITPILPLLPIDEMGHVLEPTAGRGNIVRVLAKAGVPEITAIEIQPEICRDLQHTAYACGTEHACQVLALQGDFLQLEPEWWDDYHERFIVGNPPYTKPRPTIGLEIVERCLEQVSETGGVVAMLLQHDFGSGVERTERIHDRWPPSCYPLRRRPRFSGTKQTGTRPFSWFVWRFGRFARHPEFKVL